MKLFETFNFDIIIILVLIASVLLGYYHSLYRQARKTLVLIGPAILLFFAFSYIKKAIDSIGLIKNIFNFIANIFVNLFNIYIYQNTIYNVVLYIILYIIIAFILRVIYGLIKIPAYKKVLNQPKTSSRIIASFLGLANAYIIVVILMILSKPLIVIDYNRPLTNLVTSTNNEIITITKLNQYQNVNVDLYHKYQNSVDHFTGRAILNDYQEILAFFNNDEASNAYLKNVIYPILSDESKLLIGTITADDYISAFIEIKDGKTPYQEILKLEKNNEKYQEIYANYQFLIQNQGYVSLLEVEDLNMSFEGLFDYLSLNKDVISNSFKETRWKDEFLNKINSYQDYQTNLDTYLTLLSEDLIIPDSIEGRVKIFETMVQEINRNESFKEIFYQKFDKKNDNQNIITIIEMMKTIDKYQETINQMPSNLSIVIKVILSNQYQEWFVNHTWETQSLLSSYLLEVISDSSGSGNDLYHEYFFYEYLVNENQSFTIEEPLNSNDITNIFLRMDQFISSNLIDEDNAIQYMKVLLTDKNSSLYDLYYQNKLSSTFFDDIITIDSRYISDDIIDYLT